MTCTVEPAMEDVVPSADPPRSARAGFAGFCLAMAIPSLATSIANAALPALGRAFATPFHASQWIILSYLLAVTTLIIAAGRLGDMIGRRPLLLAGIALFTAASLTSGIAPTFGWLIAMRAAQGAGAAIMMALTMATVSDIVPRARIGRAMGMLGAMSATGTALGPALGGALVTLFGWPAIFLVNVPLGVAAFLCIRHGLPAGPRPARSARLAFDGGGLLLLFLTLAAYALAMTAGHGPMATSSLLLIACAGGLWFLAVDTRAASPLVPLQLLRDGALRGGLAASALVSTIMMTSLVVGPFYLSQALGLDPVMTGMALSAGPVVAAICGAPAGRLADRVGPARAVRAGLAGIAAASLLLSLCPVRFGVAGYIAPVVLLTASYATFQAACNGGIMAGAADAQRGVVSGLLNLSRNLGLVSGASVMGAIFAWSAGTADIAAASPGQLAFAMRVSFAVASALAMLALAVSPRSPASGS